MKKTLFALAMAAAVQTASATIIFSENFEGDLSQWTGVYAWLPPTSTIVNDPLQGDHALRAGFNSGGDIRNITPITSSTGNYVVSFDYLGIAVPGSVPGDFGGFVYFTTKDWIAGTSASSGYPNNLIDDGAWHHYTFSFSTTPGNSIYLEDWNGSGSARGDAFFDNILVTDGAPEAVPEPGTLGLMALGLLGLGIVRRKVRK